MTNHAWDDYTDYQKHVLEKMHREAGDARRALEKKRKMSKSSAPTPVVTRDETGRFVFGPPAPKPPTRGVDLDDAYNPRLDWMVLEYDLSVQRIMAVDLETAEWVQYTRRQASADVECLWAGEGDVITPEGHTTERMMEMWPSGYRVVKNFVPGYEPPHMCPPKPTPCVYCRAMKRREN